MKSGQTERPDVSFKPFSAEKESRKGCLLAMVVAGIGLAAWETPLSSQGQTLGLENTYLAGLNTDTTNTVEVARNSAAILGGPLTGSGGLTLRGGYFTTASSLLSLINNDGNTFSGNLTVDTDGGTLRLSGNLYVTNVIAIQGAVLPGMTAGNTLTVRPNSRFEIEDNITGSAAGYAVNRLGSEGNRPAVRLESSTFNYSGANSAAAMTQTVGSLTLCKTYSTVNVTRNNASSTPKLILNDLSADLGATVNFSGTSLGTAAANVAQIIFLNPPTPVGGILPAYARANASDWATNGANGITPLASYVATIQGAGANDNVKVTGAQTITGNNTINSLNWSLTGNLNLDAYALTLRSGGFLNNNATVVTGNTAYVTAGTGNGVLTPLYVYPNATMNWYAQVRNNPAGSGNAVAFVQTGAGAVTFSQTNDNDYSGGTFVNAGSLTLAAIANRRYLGTGPVVVDNAGLNLGHIGATANTNGPDYSIYNSGYVFIPNYAFTTNDTFYIGPGAIVYGTAISAGSGLNSLDRGIGGSATSNITLATDAIIGQPALSAPFNPTNGSIQNLGTAADLYYGLSAAQTTSNGMLSIGNGTPFKGLSTLRANSAWNLGTLNVPAGTSNIYLQGLAVPVTAPYTLTLGNTAPTVGGPIFRLSGAGTVDVQVLGQVTLDDDATVFGDTNTGKRMNLVVTPGATLQINSINALGSGSGTASATVRRGGTLQMTGNPAGLSGATRVQAGGRLLANNVGGLTGSGQLTLDAGSIVQIATYANGFSGAQAANTSAEPGVIVRLNVASIGAASEPLDVYWAGKSPIYQVYGANYWPINPVAANTTIMTLNRTPGGVGGMLINDLGARTITAVPNGKIVIGPNGGVMAASANTIFTLAQPFALGTNELIIGSPLSVDGTAPLLGKVTLSALPNYNTASNGSRITVVPGATLGIGATEVLPDAADVIMNGTLSLAAAEVIGSLSGTGLVDLVAQTLTIGRNNVATNFGGRFTGTTGGIVKSGTNRNDLTGADSTWSGAGTVRVTDGILALSGNGKLPLSGTAAFTLLGNSAFVLDNSGVNITDRLTGAAPGITFQGGTFRFIGKNGQAASESLGMATPGSGASTVEIINGSGVGSSSELLFSNLTLGTGTVNFIGQNGTLGSAGDHPRVKFTAGVTAGTVAGWATVHGAPAYYDATYGLRAFTVGEGTEFNGAVVQTTSNTVFTAANTSPMESLTAARTVNSLWINSPGAGKYISLGSAGSNNLAITSGRLSLTGNDDFEIRRGAASTGGIAQGATRLFINTEGNRVLTVSVPVVGTGGISKDGTGALELNATNIFTGALMINDGTVRYGATGDLAATMPLTIWNAGQFDLWGKTDSIGAVTIYSGGLTNSVAGGDLTVASLTMGAGPDGSTAYVETGSGLLRLGGNVTYSLGNAGMSVLSGNLHLNGATRTFTVNNSLIPEAFIDLDVPAVIQGGTGDGLTKALTGTMRLSSSNAFDGPVSITGTLIAQHPFALGKPSATRTFSVATSSSLVFDGTKGDITVPANYPTVTLTGSGNTLYGPVSGALINQSGSNTVPGAIALQTPSVQLASLAGKLTLNGDISGAFPLTVDGGGNMELGGVLGTAAGTLIKNGGGTLTLSGSGNNTFTGGTTINGGKILLAKSGSANAINSGLVTINSGGILQYAPASANINLINTAAVTLNGTGQLDFNGASDTVGNLIISSITGPAGDSVSLTNSTGGGTLTIGTLTVTPLSGFTTALETGSGTLKLGGDVTFTANGTGKAALRGNLDLGAATRTLTINPGTDSPGVFDMNVSAVVTGAVGSGLIKAGSGILRLGAANTFDGPVTVTGILRLADPQALGLPSLARTITVNASSSLTLDGVGITDPANRFTLSLNGTGSTLVGPYTGALVNQSGNNTVPQAVTLVTTAPTIASLTPGDTLTMTGTISSVNLGLTVTGNGNTDLNGPLALGSGALTKNGNGILRLAATNTYSGTTTISGGRLEVNGLIGAGAVTVNAGATFGGSGTVSGTVTVASGGVFAPGAAGVGVLQMTTNLTLNSGTVFECQLNPFGANSRAQVGGNIVLTSTWTLRLKDGGGTADLTNRIVFLTYAGVLTTFGTGQIDASALDPLLWDASGATIVNDYMNKQVYVTGLRYIGPRVEVGDVTVTEGDSGTINAVFTVSVAGGAENVTVNFASTNDTAAGTDYTATNGALSIAGGATTSTTVTVVVQGDTSDEWPSERFFLDLSNAQNARIARWRGTGTIRDDDAGFGYRMPITFTGYTGAETLTNYPALVKLDETLNGFNFSQFLSPTTGADLRFTDSTGTRELNFEIEQWTGSGEAFVWVQIPELASTNTTIWAMWGDPARTAAPAYATNGATWSENFLAVWHLHSMMDAIRFPDSSSNAFHGTNLGVVAAAGRIGGAQDFTGTRRIDVSALTYDGQWNSRRSYAFEFWVKSPQTTTRGYLFDALTGRLIPIWNEPAAGQIGYYDGAYRGGYGSGLNNDQWQHLAFVFDGHAPTGTLYANGVALGTLPYTPLNLLGAKSLGSIYNAFTQPFDGLMDEARVSRGVRSADWIRADAMNQSDPAAFMTIGAVENDINELVVRNRDATDITAHSATLNGVLLHTGPGGPADAYFCWGTANGGDATSGWQRVDWLGGGWTNGQFFATNIVNLLANQTYWYRAFAVDSQTNARALEARSFITRRGRYVALSGNGSAGTNWATAFTNLQTALNAATSGVEDIYIAGGNYTVTNELLWTNSGLRVMGGYEGVGTPGAVDPAQWPSVLARPTSTTNRIFSILNVTNAWLRGVTIRNGYRSRSDTHDFGGGLYITNSDLILDTCVIHTNHVQPSAGNLSSYGGGIYALNSTLLITNCLFRENRLSGGGVSSTGVGDGSALFASGGRVTVTDSEFIGNVGASVANQRSSGTIYLNGGVPVIRRTRIVGNTVNGYAGGIYLTGANLALVEDSVIQNNYAVITTGGIWLNGGTVRNSLIASNTTQNTAGGVNLQGDTARLQNVTVVHNATTNALTIAGIHIFKGIVENTIAYFNTRVYDNLDVSISSDSGTVTYACTMPLRTGTGNTASDPDFMGATNGNFRLRPGSPGEDTATLLDWMTDDAQDLAGQPRILNQGPDMGCYETGIPDVPLMINFAADRTAGLDSLLVTFTSLVTGNSTNGLTYYWDFDNDGDFDEQGFDKATVQHTYGPGIYSVRLRVTNNQDNEEISTRTDYIFVSASEIYVSLTGDGSAGTNWATAFTNLQQALDFASGSNTLYIAGQTFTLNASLLLGDRQSITLLGGYEANVATVGPGPYDVDQWPTVLRRNAAAGSFRILDVTFVSRLRLERLTFADGNTTAVDAIPAPGSGGALRFISSVADITDCVFSNNIANSVGNGYAYGGAIYLQGSTGTVTRTRFVGNRARNASGTSNAGCFGGGVSASGGRLTVVDSLFMTNYADAYGHHSSYGGAIHMTGAIGLVSNVQMIGNQSSPNRADKGYGGGIYITAGMQVMDCVIISNSVKNAATGFGGGGVFMTGGLLRNSLVADNDGTWDGGGLYASGGTVESVTVAGNRNTEAGKIAGAFLSGTVVVSNSIFASNIRQFDSVDVSVSDTGGTLAYSLTRPFRSGTGNVDGEPGFANISAKNYRLGPGSPAIDAGLELDWMTGALDIDRNSRVSGDAPDLGCFETQEGGQGPLTIAFTADTTLGLDSLRVIFSNAVSGTETTGLNYFWDFDNDGTNDMTGIDLRVVTNDYSAGRYSVRLRVTSTTEESSLIRSNYIHVSASEIFVSPAGNGADGLSWATAFNSVQDALDFAAYSNTIYIAGGTYTQMASVIWSGHLNVQILGGYEGNVATAGPGPYDAALWPTVIRRDPGAGSFRVMDVLNLTSGRLARVTVANGITPTDLKAVGGGLRIQNSSLEIEDCIFDTNKVAGAGNGDFWGGGIYAHGSTLVVRRTIFRNGLITGGQTSNSRAQGGGLAAEGGSQVSIFECQFLNNTVDAGNNGSCGGAVYISGCTGLIRNSLMVGNQASPNVNRHRGLGGAVYMTAGLVLENCTIASNQVWNDGTYSTTTAGGVYMTGGAVTNCIVYFNENRHGTPVASDVYSADWSRFSYSCAPELTGGANNNIADNPMFESAGALNFQLRQESPCLNRGRVQPWMASTLDLIGNARVAGGGVDMGAYELLPVPGTIFIVR